MQEVAGGDKANMDTGEIDPRVFGRDIEFRRGVKARVGKIGAPLERAAVENGFAIEARTYKRNV